MPKQITQFNIFISSPSHLDAERATIRKVLQELSSELSQDAGVEFTLFDWNADAVPGIGVDAQAVITSQLRYDIYVGVMGAFFGTRTGRAGSGTEEEFEDAFDRYIKAPESIRVLFYFKGSSTDIFSVPPDQLAKVQQFREKIASKGVFYHTFSDYDSLASVVRSHFRSLIREQWSGNEWSVISLPVANSIANQISPSRAEQIEVLGEEREDFGLYEVTKLALLAAEELTAHMERITLLSRGLTSSVTTQVPKVVSSGSSGEELDRTIEQTDAMAQNISDFTAAVTLEIPIYQSSTETITRSLEGIANLFFNEKTGRREDLEKILAASIGMVSSVRAVRMTLQRFREILERIPSLTMRVRSARKYLLRIIDELIASYTVFVTSSDDVIANIQERLGSSEG